MVPIVAWVMTLAASIIIAAIFIVQHLESKYRPYVRALEKEKLVLARINAALLDEAEVSKQRYRALRSDTMKQTKEETE